MLVWNEFLIAQVGASAALAGLVFVGISINLSQIIAIPALPGRALEAIVALSTVLIVATVLLVPEQAVRLAGLEALLASLVGWGIVSYLNMLRYRRVEEEFRRQSISTIALAQVGAFSFVIMGWALLLGWNGGIYWLVPAVVFSYLAAIMDAWVLLVEINR